MSSIRRDNLARWNASSAMHNDADDSNQGQVEYPSDAEWEDEEIISTYGGSQAPSLTPSTDPNNMRLTPRRRNVRKQYTGTAVASPRRGTSIAPPTQQQIRYTNTRPPKFQSQSQHNYQREYEHEPQHERDPEPLINIRTILTHIQTTTRFIFTYILDILKSAFLMLKHPLKLLVFLWLLTLISGMVWFQLRKAVSPFCWIPGMKQSNLCLHPLTSKSPSSSSSSSSSAGNGNGKSKWADYDRLAQVQSHSFGQMLGETVGNSALSLDIKKAEMATSDLATLVRVSNLKAKSTLEGHLVTFNSHAKKAGRGLQKLSSKVGGAVDSIMAINDHALSSIEQAKANEPHPWSFSALLNPNAKLHTQQVITTSFDQSMGVLSTNMQNLIIEAELNLKRLDDLDASLNVLHEVVAREETTISQEKEEVLAQLWTILGGNRKELRNFQQNLGLLKNLGEYRKQARAHVVATLQSLEALSEDMEDMRERVAAPELMGVDVPAEVHMKAIKMSLERMKEGRIKARELEEAALNRLRTIDADDED